MNFLHKVIQSFTRRYATFQFGMRRTLPVVYSQRILAARFRPSCHLHGPVILFASYDPGYSVEKHWMGHLEALVAKHLELVGSAKPVFLIKNRISLRWNVLGGFNFPKIITFADLPQPDISRYPLPDLSDLDLSGLKRLEVCQVPIGRLAAANVLRDLGKSHLDLQSDHELIEQTMQKAIYQLAIAEQVLDLVRPDVVFTNHSTYVEQGGVMFHLALGRGIRTFSIQERSAHSFIFREFSPQERMEYASGLSKSEWQKLLANRHRDAFITEAQTILQQRVVGNYETPSQSSPIGLKSQPMSPDAMVFPDKKPVVGVFTHLPWDASAAYYYELFPSYREWVAFTARTAAQNDKVNWIFRVHPDESFRGSVEDTAAIIRQNLPSEAKHIQIIESDVPISSYALAPRLHAAITVRGTLAIELPCLGVPVICAGSGQTSIATYNIFPNSIEEYRQSLLNIDTLPRLTPQQIEQAHLYLYGHFIHKVLPIECVENMLELKAIRQVTPEKIINDRGLQQVAKRVLN